MHEYTHVNLSFTFTRSRNHHHRPRMYSKETCQYCTCEICTQHVSCIWAKEEGQPPNCYLEDDVTFATSYTVSYASSDLCEGDPETTTIPSLLYEKFNEFQRSASYELGAHTVCLTFLFVFATFVGIQMTWRWLMGRRRNRALDRVREIALDSFGSRSPPRSNSQAPTVQVSPVAPDSRNMNPFLSGVRTCSASNGESGSGSSNGSNSSTSLANFSYLPLLRPNFVRSASMPPMASLSSFATAAIAPPTPMSSRASSIEPESGRSSRAGSVEPESQGNSRASSVEPEWGRRSREGSVDRQSRAGSEESGLSLRSNRAGSLFRELANVLGNAMGVVPEENEDEGENGQRGGGGDGGNGHGGGQDPNADTRGWGSVLRVWVGTPLGSPIGNSESESNPILVV